MQVQLNSPKPQRIAVLQATWHKEIVAQAVLGFEQELEVQGWPAGACDRFELPGAFELPLQAQTLARSGLYHAIVACGLVVDGGIYRHDFVAAAVIDGLMRVQLDTGIPVVSTVMTPHHFQNNAEHRAFFAAHFAVKGREAAQVCMHLLGHSARAPA